MGEGEGEGGAEGEGGREGACAQATHDSSVSVQLNLWWKAAGCEPRCGQNCPPPRAGLTSARRCLGATPRVGPPRPTGLARGERLAGQTGLAICHMEANVHTPQLSGQSAVIESGFFSHSPSRALVLVRVRVIMRGRGRIIITLAATCPDK